MTNTMERTEEIIPGEQHLLSIADLSGDLRQMWDPRNEDEVKVAKKAFDDAKKKGYLAYSVNAENGESTGEVIREFDPSLGKIIMTKQLQGG